MRDQTPENVQSDDVEAKQESVELQVQHEISENAPETAEADAEASKSTGAAKPEDMGSNSAEDDEDEDSQGDSYFGLEDSDSDRSEYDEFAGFRWLEEMEEMEGFVTRTGASSDVGTQNKIGYCEGKLIRRHQIRAVFHDDMEEPSRETSLLAFELFDRYGRLRSEIKEHPTRKGSGIWNKELDGGDILLPERVEIDKKYRRCGLGKKLVTAMLDKTREKSRRFFAIAWPTFLNSGERRTEAEGKTDAEYGEIFDREQDIAINLFRSMGFRRIGSSYWFGLASDPDHPSHLLAAKDDYDPPAPHAYTPDSQLQPLQKSLVKSEDIECVAMLEQLLQKIPATDARWLQTDKERNTLLHSAAVNSKPKTVGWIMKHPFGHSMLEIRNNAGDTPLEATLIVLEANRTRKEINMLTLPMSDRFEGHSKASVLCLAILKGLPKVTSLDLSRLSSGCSCGQCISGFLSPRMCFALLYQAEISHDMLSSNVTESLGFDWVEWNMHHFRYLPERVRENFRTNKSMPKGFANLCDHFATCLRAKKVPTELNVLSALENASEWPPHTKNYFQRGGTVAAVGSMIFQSAMEQDELAGDGEHKEAAGEHIAELPECRNDHEFGFVSGMCGYKRVSNITYVDPWSGEPVEDD